MKKTVVVVHDKATIVGGASRIAIQSAIALSMDEEYKVVFFAANSRIDNQLLCSDVRVECIDTVSVSDNRNIISSSLYGIWNRKSKKKFEELLVELDPKTTIIHIHGWTKALSTSIFSAIKKHGFSTVVTLHDYFSVCPNGGFYNYTTRKLCTLRPMSYYCIKCNCDKRSFPQKIWRYLRELVQNKYVAYNPDMNYIYISDRVQKLTKPYLSSKKFYYLRNPIEITEKDQTAHENSQTFICVGRVSEEKGVEDFCRAVTEIQKNSKMRGQVIGTGPLLEKLRNKYPNIEFVGWIESRDIQRCYREARCLVFPSICNEGAPLIIPEALACDLPCIVSDCTSATEMIEDNETGFVFKAKDTDDLISKMKLASNKDVIIKLQREIRNHFNVDDYSMETHVEGLKKIYDEILTLRK